VPLSIVKIPLVVTVIGDERTNGAPVLVQTAVELITPEIVVPVCAILRPNTLNNVGTIIMRASNATTNVFFVGYTP
jgi:hypothetical protein